MNSKNSMELYKALELILQKRQGYDIQRITDFAGGYNLKRQFALQARQLILHNYASIVRSQYVPNKPFYDQEDFNFEDPIIQLAYWIDSLLHNCRGALETLGHIVNYVYQLGLKESDVTFFTSLKLSKVKEASIYQILNDINNDDWFTIVNKLRNRSYHIVLNTFVPKIRYGTPTLLYTIRFPVNHSKSNLTHETLNSFLNAGFNIRMASMELAEFANFITVRLEEYLSQVDTVIYEDCMDISNSRSLRSKSTPPKLKISWMKLHSWRNIIEVDNQVFGKIGRDDDLE